MKKIFLESSIVLSVLFLFGISQSFADATAVVITEPATGATVSSPVKVCMATHGVTVEPAKNGVNAGKGHHHILVDVGIPADLSKPVGKDANHIHMGDGSTCKELKLSAGKHVIRALFASGNHVPHSPPLTATVVVTVK